MRISRAASATCATCWRSFGTYRSQVQILSPRPDCRNPLFSVAFSRTRDGRLPCTSCWMSVLASQPEAIAILILEAAGVIHQAHNPESAARYGASSKRATTLRGELAMNAAIESSMGQLVSSRRADDSSGRFEPRSDETISCLRLPLTQQPRSPGPPLSCVAPWGHRCRAARRRRRRSRRVLVSMPRRRQKPAPAQPSP